MSQKLNSQPPIQKSARNKLAFCMSLLSFFFLFPGIYLSMLTVSTRGSVEASLPRMESSFLGGAKQAGTDTKHIPIKIFDTSRSILKTVHDLWERNYFFVAGMILLFSVIVPVIKGTLVTFIFFHKSAKNREKIFSFVKAIGKWSMCDVFIVAIFLAFLSTGATQTQNRDEFTFMGHAVDVNVAAGMHAHLQIGFWCFLSYCLLSLLALQLYDDAK